MDYREFVPDDFLAPYVKCYWALSGDALGPHEPERVLPDGCTELVFHFRDEFERLDSGAVHRQPRILLAGQLQSALLLRPTGRIGLVAVRFRPWGAHHFLPMPMNELTGRFAAGRDLFGLRLQELEEQLLEAANPPAAVRVLEGFLHSAFREKDSGLAMLCAREMISSGGMIRVRELARRYHVSERQLERRTKQAIGLTPKELGRIVRMRRFVQALTRNPGTFAEAAHLCGFYDQAHLGREFKSFVGVTPGQFVREIHPMNDLFL